MLYRCHCCVCSMCVVLLTNRGVTRRQQYIKTVAVCNEAYDSSTATFSGVYLVELFPSSKAVKGASSVLRSLSSTSPSSAELKFMDSPPHYYEFSFHVTGNVEMLTPMKGPDQYLNDDNKSAQYPQVKRQWDYMKYEMEINTGGYLPTLMTREGRVIRPESRHSYYEMDYVPQPQKELAQLPMTRRYTLAPAVLAPYNVDVHATEQAYVRGRELQTFSNGAVKLLRTGQCVQCRFQLDTDGSLTRFVHCPKHGRRSGLEQALKQDDDKLSMVDDFVQHVVRTRVRPLLEMTQRDIDNDVLPKDVTITLCDERINVAVPSALQYQSYMFISTVRWKAETSITSTALVQTTGTKTNTNTGGSGGSDVIEANKKGDNNEKIFYFSCNRPSEYTATTARNPSSLDCPKWLSVTADTRDDTTVAVMKLRATYAHDSLIVNLGHTPCVPSILLSDSDLEETFPTKQMIARQSSQSGDSVVPSSPISVTPLYPFFDSARSDFVSVASNRQCFPCSNNRWSFHKCTHQTLTYNRMSPLKQFIETDLEYKQWISRLDYAAKLAWIKSYLATMKLGKDGVYKESEVTKVWDWTKKEMSQVGVCDEIIYSASDEKSVKSVVPVFTVAKTAETPSPTATWYYIITCRDARNSDQILFERPYSFKQLRHFVDKLQSLYKKMELENVQGVIFSTYDGVYERLVKIVHLISSSKLLYSSAMVNSFFWPDSASPVLNNHVGTYIGGHACHKAGMRFGCIQWRMTYANFDTLVASPKPSNDAIAKWLTADTRAGLIEVSTVDVTRNGYPYLFAKTLMSEFVKTDSALTAECYALRPPHMVIAQEEAAQQEQ